MGHPAVLKTLLGRKINVDMPIFDKNKSSFRVVSEPTST